MHLDCDLIPLLDKNQTNHLEECVTTKLIRTGQKKLTYGQWKNKSQEMLDFKLHKLSITEN